MLVVGYTGGGETPETQRMEAPDEAASFYRCGCPLQVFGSGSSDGDRTTRSPGALCDQHCCFGAGTREDPPAALLGDRGGTAGGLVVASLAGARQGDGDL